MELLAELEKLDPELANAVRDFDLDACIKNLNPPTAGEIIKDLQPIPTLDEVVELLHDPSKRPTMPALPADMAQEVARLEERIEELRARGLRVSGPGALGRAEQDAALDEAVRLAEHVLQIRQEHQGNTHELIRWRDGHGSATAWCEVTDAQRRLSDLGLLRRTDAAGRAATTRSGEFDLQGQEAYGRGDLASAGRACRDALAMRRRLFPGDHPAVAESLNNLATILWGRGALDQAEALFRAARAMQGRLFPGDHPDTAAGLDNLGQILRVRGALEQAELLSRAGLAMRLRLFSGDQAEVTTSLNNLATILRARGALEQAEPLFREALAMKQRLSPADRVELAAGLNNLAGILWERGSLEQAEPLYREALAMKQRMIPGDHQSVALSLNNLASILRERGALDQAEPLYRDALAMVRRLFPGDHPDVAASLSGLAFLLEDRGALDQAEPLYREALEMRRRLFAGDQPEVAMGLRDLATVRQLRGEPEQAEPLYREALAMSRRLFPGDHRDLVRSLNGLALAVQARGDLKEAEPLLEEALAMSERLRTAIVGGERERADFAAQLRLTQRSITYASLLAKLSRGAESMAVVERGRGRTVLDLLERRGHDVFAEARTADAGRAAKLDVALAAETAARTRLASTESLLGGRSRERKALLGRDDLDRAARDTRLAEYDREISELKYQVGHQRQALAQAGAALLNELRGAFPAARPAGAEEIMAALRPGELVLSFAWSGEAVMTMTAVGAAGGIGSTTGDVVADSKDAVATLAEAAAQVRAAIEHPSEVPGTPADARDAARTLLAALLPAGVRSRVSSATSLVVTPDGPLHGIPIEALLALAGDDPLARSLSGKPIAYAPSATLFIRNRETAQTSADPGTGSASTASTLSALIIGDPLFDRSGGSPGVQVASRGADNGTHGGAVTAAIAGPDHGVLIAAAAPGGQAAGLGIKHGDVLLSYDGQQLNAQNTLQAAVASLGERIQKGERAADAPAAITFWREGQVIQAQVKPGKLGVQVQPGDPAEGLRSWALLDQLTRDGGIESMGAQISATDQVRLHGGALKPLPGTRREAGAIAVMIPGSTVLLGEDATLPKLREAVGDHVPRILHLATHGLTGNAARPYDASLAFTQPVQAAPDDIGFLTLDELMGKWLGRLRGCDLVVLSACDTGRGVAKGDSVMALPIGFFAAGVPTVIASLWKVDDTATALLMTRMYQDLLGRTNEPRSVDGHEYKAGEPLPKLAGLREAQAWLRGLTAEQARVARDTLVSSASAASASRGGETDRSAAPLATAPNPYDHPFYWAAFVLIGSPE